MDNFKKIIIEICQELNIKLTLLTENDWVKVLEHDNKIRYIQGYKFGLNDHALGNMMDDKGLFYQLMKMKNNEIIEHKNILHDYNRENVLKYFKEQRNCLVIKGNIGTCGREVYRVYNEIDLLKKMDELFLSQFSLSLCPYYHIINEYRVILLNKEIKIIYGKSKPVVIGNGTDNLLNLAINYNYDFFSQKRNQYLIDVNYIPKLNEVIELDWKFNLSKGAKMFLDIDSDLKNKLSEIALKVVRDANIIFGSVDIIETTSHQLLIMEANSGVMMDSLIRQMPNGYEFAKSVYKEAISLMFK